jgi:hypothetical protein
LITLLRRKQGHVLLGGLGVFRHRLSACSIFLSLRVLASFGFGWSRAAFAAASISA